jgi:hypothetical protein
MLAEIFMVRLEAERLVLVQGGLPSSTSSFIPISPRSHFVFKETAKGTEASREERPVAEVREQKERGWRRPDEVDGEL